LGAASRHDIGHLLRIIIRIGGGSQLINEVLRQVVAIDKSLQHPDFLIDTADVGDESETSVNRRDAIDTPMGRDHEVRGETGRIDHHHADGIQVKQLQIRWADLHAGHGQHFQSLGVNLHRERAAQSEKFRSECGVVVEVWHVEDQLTGDGQQERLWLNLIGHRLVSTAFAHACQSQRFRLHDIGGIELQVGKCCRIDTEGSQGFQSSLQFGHAPHVQPHFSGFDDHSCCRGAYRPEKHDGHRARRIEGQASRQ
jgi:hypothetical protein